MALVFKNLAQGAQAIGPYLEQEFGLSGGPQGPDFVVTTSGKGARHFEFVSLGGQLELKLEQDAHNAKHLMSLASNAMRRARAAVKAGAPLGNLSGILGEVANALDSFVSKDERDAVQYAATVVIPLMRDRLSAESVSAVSLNTDSLQRHISQAKIMLLASKFGFVKAKDLLDHGQPLSATLPYALDTLGYVDAMTRLSPLALTLPVHHLDTAWHFQARAMWNFDRVLANGLMPEFMLRLNPLTRENHLLGFHGLRNMSRDNVWRTLRFVVKGINRLISWLVDPRTFVDPISGEVRLLRQVQAHSAIHLLFADISAMNYCTDAHTRISLATAAIDKFANLRVQVGGAKESETMAFQSLCSLAQRDALISSVGGLCDDFGYSELKDALGRVIKTSYDTLHDELGAQATAAKSSEAERLSRLWSQRNVRHGSFLMREQFERLYLESHGSVPSTIASLPYVMVLGLLSDPARFVGLTPIIGP